MGAYLSKPVTDKVTEFEETDYLISGVSSMQGWRVFQEDAHTIIPNYNDKFSLFGVYDGHGGAEVSKYTADNFPNFILKNFDFKINDLDYISKIQKVFIDFDLFLIEDDTRLEITKIKELSKDEKEDVSKLNEESTMPFGELLKRYTVLKSLFDNKGKVDENNFPKDVDNGDKNETDEDENPDSVVPKRRHDDNHNVDKKPRINQTENVETDAVSTENKLNPENSESSNDEDYVEVSNSAESSNSPEISDESIDDELNMLKNSELTNNKPANMNMVSDKPVYDSGCTAVVALLSFEHKTISVINIGDSRCVLCRDGKAMDLSVDHKPEDTIERNRIEKAGGCVTEDGRVNGGLNLSRAFGDHTYKINKSLSHEDQMITPKPDVKTVKLVKEDEFMIIACDGIWNVMTSEEIISFVSERLNDKNNKMSINDIISAVFDKCISPDTLGDGSGCDNMTCIIVQFKDSFLKGTESMYVHETK